ncbi:hypothetical protein [Dipodfec virus UOA04_Rod_763]|nr:hypothetical protein [Dipodfec virus UOA04_Rod_763]
MSKTTKTLTIYAYRYFWSEDPDHKTLAFKTIVDIPEAHNAFISAFAEQFPDTFLSREYLYEQDCSKIGMYEPLTHTNSEISPVEVE